MLLLLIIVTLLFIGANSEKPATHSYPPVTPPEPLDDYDDYDLYDAPVTPFNVFDNAFDDYAETWNAHQDRLRNEACVQTRLYSGPRARGYVGDARFKH
ncbi:MAG: hypothetical protein WC790_00495 [Candidatus Paceibacterota bacterium]|jgi:hypothetical protein